MISKSSNVHHTCTGFSKVKKANGNWIFLPIIVMPLVVTRRIKVANALYMKNDGRLLTAGRAYVIDMTTAAGTFVAPVPSLSDVSDVLDSFEASIINAAAVRTPQNTSTRNLQREAVLNILSALGNYVEDVANSAGTDPVVIIESAGMRPKRFTIRRRKMWDVTHGVLSGSLKLTAASVRNGTHEWAYTTTPTDESSWVMIPSVRADMVFSGLTPGSFVSCRHRTVTTKGASDWEGHDPVIVI